jgi:hypothetical protein
MDSGFRRSVLSLILLTSVTWAQQKIGEKSQPAAKPKTPSVTCPPTEASKACSSFRQLLDAHDKEILEILSSPTSYVCFRPKDDAFLIFHMNPLSRYGWVKSEDRVGQIQYSSAGLTEYRDGVLYQFKDARRYWYRYSPDDEPMFHSETTDGMFKGLKVDILDTEISVDYPFKNQNGGTTEYSLSIRRSTGRFTETFRSESEPATTYSGTCLIYR